MSKPKLSVYAGISLDGFIARKDGGIDWLEFDTSDDPAGEDYGFAEFFATVDVLLMGRHTFEQVLTFDQWIYGDTHVMVLSHSLGSEVVPARLEGKVSIASGEPEAILESLTQQGFQHVYVDGGITVQAFIAAGLIDEITVGVIPVLIGDGIPLFSSLPQDVRLKHLGTKSFPSGLVQLKYKTVADPSGG